MISKDGVLCASVIFRRKTKLKSAVEDFLSVLSFVLAIEIFQKFYTSHVVGENNDKKIIVHFTTW